MKLPPLCSGNRSGNKILDLQLWKICGFSRVAFSREGSFREAASAAVGLRPNRSISACQLVTSKRFVVIFSITRNWTLSTTAFQRKINRKSRKKLQKKKIRRVGKRGREAASDGGFRRFKRPLSRSATAPRRGAGSVRWWLPVTAPPGEMQLQRQMQFTVTAPPVKMQFRNARRRF